MEMNIALLEVLNRDGIDPEILKEDKILLIEQELPYQ